MSSVIEIFRTTISTKNEANKILKNLQACFPYSKATIDLTDCDRVLRVAGQGIVADKIIKVVRDSGFVCEILE